MTAEDTSHDLYTDYMFVRLPYIVGAFMDKKRLLTHVRKACSDYNMINDGDVIAVGISGGKDSLTLLYALHELRRFYPKKFDVKAITVGLGFPNCSFSPVIDWCAGLGIEYRIVETKIGAIVFDERKEKNPCSLCANMRRGALNNAAKEMGCNKIAYGHNKDDTVESFFMSLIYEGRIHTFRPVTYLDKADLTVIRPLLYAPENGVLAFAKRNELPIIPSPCPVDGRTKRQEIKEFIKHQNTVFKGFEDNAFGAIMRSNLGGWN